MMGLRREGRQRDRLSSRTITVTGVKPGSTDRIPRAAGGERCDQFRVLEYWEYGGCTWE